MIPCCRPRKASILGGHALAVVEGDTIRGYGVMRPCRTGHRIGPLFAANASVAEQLLVALASRVPGEPMFLDVPEIMTWRNRTSRF